ncbi:MAG: O-antigen ligase family protein [Microgenomates group bacterium]
MSRKEIDNSISSVLQQIIVGVLHFILLVTPLYFRFVTEELFEFNKLILVYGATTIVATLWIVRMILEKRVIWKHSKFHIPIAIFILSQLVSTLFTIDIRTSLLGYYGRFHGGLLSLLSYAVLYAVLVSTVTVSDALKLLKTTFLGAFLVAVYAILEHFGHSVSCLVLSQGAEFNTACWVQQVQERVFASFGQPNWLAAYCITLIPVGWYLSSSPKNSRVEKMFYLLVTTLLTIATIYTKSRSGFLGLLVGLGGLLFGLGILFLKNKKEFHSIFSIKILGILLALFIAISAILGTPFSTSIVRSEPLQMGMQEDALPNPDRLSVGGTDSGEIRRIVWEGSIDVWKRYPLFGSGVETFAYSYYRDRPEAHNIVSEWDFLYNKAHNELLNFLATTGIFGVTAYIMMLGTFALSVFFMVFNPSSQSKFLSFSKKISLSDTALMLSLVAGIAAQSASNFFGFSTVMITVLLYMYFGLIVLLNSKYSKENQGFTEKSAPFTRLVLVQKIALVICIVISASVLLQIYRYWLADVSYANAKSLGRNGEIDASYDQIQSAILLQPNEPLYYDEMAATLAPLSVDLASVSEATAAAEVAASAVLASDIALAMNPHHLNFYKSRAQILITLSQLDPSLLKSANEVLSTAIEKAPTDAKLYYNRGMVLLSLNQETDAQHSFEKAVELKPNYIDARFELGKIYESQLNFSAAKTQYEFILKNLTPDNPPVQERFDALLEAESEGE